MSKLNFNSNRPISEKKLSKIVLDGPSWAVITGIDFVVRKSLVCELLGVGNY